MAYETASNFTFNSTIKPKVIHFPCKLPNYPLLSMTPSPTLISPFLPFGILSIRVSQFSITNHFKVFDIFGPLCIIMLVSL